MRFLFGFFFLCVTSLFSVEFPSSSEQVESFSKESLKQFELRLHAFTRQSLETMDFQSVVAGWTGVIDPLFSKGVVLTFLPLTIQDPKVAGQAAKEAQNIQQRLVQVMQDPKVLSIFLQFVNKAIIKPEELSAFQWYQIAFVLQSVNAPLLQKEVQELQGNIASLEKQPFIYQKGEGTEKHLTLDRTMTVLNWNVCALDHQLSLLFGGVVPWQDRIEKIAKQIVKLAPDVICLQEMFAPEASQVLVRKLRSSYAHFYVQMGPHPAGFSLETLGIPSGLFVASKYPLSHPCFVPYGAGRSPAYRSYGVFSAELSSEGRKIGKLITTHLQPGSTEADQNYRSLQMKLIHEMTHQASCPVFLCGDFNIERKSQEFTRLLSAYEPSSYLGGNWTCCELRNYWGKAQRDLTSFLALPLDKEWLDYFFCLPTSWVQAKVEVVPVNDVHHPEEALSDHQILFATLQFQTLKVD